VLVKGIFRELPSKNNRYYRNHTLLRARHTHTHTLRERNLNKESKTHIEQHTDTMKETHYTESDTQ